VLLGLVFGVPAAARARPETYRLDVRFASSHGCSQSYASTRFDGAVTLTLDGRAATLSLVGSHSYTFGPSPGRFRQSGGKAQSQSTSSAIDLTLTGKVRRSRAALTVELDRAAARCTTRSGYYGTTQFACRIRTPVTLRCVPAQVQAYPAARGAGGAYPATGERSAATPVLRCEVTGAELGLLGDLRFQSALPLRERGLVHHLERHRFDAQSILRMPAAAPARR
jgi:hypothetical protein